MKDSFEKTLTDAVNSIIPDNLYDRIETCLPPQSERKMTMKKTTNKSQVFKILGPIAAVLIIAVGIFSGVFYSNNAKADTVIDIDVNPSVEITANKKDKVISAEAINNDGVTILDGMDLKGTDLNIAVNAVIGSMVKNGYLYNDENEILVTVRNEDTEKAEKIKNTVNEGIDNALKENNIKAEVINQTTGKDETVAKFAETNGISYGKALFVMRLVEKDSTLVAENLAKMNMRQLAGIVSAKKLDISDIVEVEADDSLEENIEDGIEDINENAKDNSVVTENAITVDKAKQIALEHAGLTADKVIFTKARYDDGEYEIDFTYGNIEYEYDINPASGKVISFEEKNKTTGQKTVSTPDVTTVIGLDKAKEIAFTNAGVQATEASIIKSELDDGEYEIEFTYGGMEYEYDIDAVTGKILSIEKETVKSVSDKKETQTTTAKKETQTTTAKKEAETTSSSIITLDAAKTLALKDAGVSASEATFTKAKLDGKEYEIEFKTASCEYEYEISATTGKITDKEKETIKSSDTGNKITLAEAKQIALAHAGLSEGDVTFTDAEYDDGEYEIEFRTPSYEYEYDISSAGRIISYEKDRR